MKITPPAPVRQVFLDDLYFGITYMDDDGKPATGNLFAIPQVKRDVAFYVMSDTRQNATPDQALLYCFSAVWSRAQWEMSVSPVFSDTPTYKMDVYQLYVKPNADYLLSLVSQVSLKDAERYVRDYQMARKKYGLS